MEKDTWMDNLGNKKYTRRDFIKKSAGAGLGIGLGLSALGSIIISPTDARAGAEKKEVELAPMTWISPRGTLQVPDDYCLWAAKDMGYFQEMGLDVTLEPGPQEALAVTKFVDQGQADIGYPSPGVITSSVDQGMDIIMVHEMMIGQVFDFAVRPDSDIKTVKDIEGKTIALGSAGWSVIVNPILVELGIDPDSG
ncbi:MAG: ABC transporter substrate-binding protein, partial [Spirochaetota bacterium]